MFGFGIISVNEIKKQNICLFNTQSYGYWVSKSQADLTALIELNFGFYQFSRFIIGIKEMSWWIKYRADGADENYFFDDISFSLLSKRFSYAAFVLNLSKRQAKPSQRNIQDSVANGMSLYKFSVHGV